MTSRFVLCLQIIFIVSNSAFIDLKSGPYKTTVVRAEKCKTTSKPFEKDPAYLFYSESYRLGGKMLLRSNFTVVRENPYFKANVRAYVKEGDKWTIMYMTKCTGCRCLVVDVLKSIFQVPAGKSCIPKGTYTYKDLSFDDVQHKWIKTCMYGRFLWTLEILTKAGTNVCWQFETDITTIRE